MMLHLWKLFALCYVNCVTIGALHSGLWNIFPGKRISGWNVTAKANAYAINVEACLHVCSEGDFGNFYSLGVSFFGKHVLSKVKRRFVENG